MTDGACNRCGQCCHILEDGKWKKCKYLIKVGDKTTCRVYRTHRLYRKLGTQNGKVMVCALRENHPYNHPGCPQNKEGQPLVDVYANPKQKIGEINGER